MVSGVWEPQQEVGEALMVVLEVVWKLVVLRVRLELVGLRLALGQLRCHRWNPKEVVLGPKSQR